MARSRDMKFVVFRNVADNTTVPATYWHITSSELLFDLPRQPAIHTPDITFEN